MIVNIQPGKEKAGMCCIRKSIMVEEKYVRSGTWNLSILSLKGVVLRKDN